MAAIKSHLADRFLDKPDKAVSVILLYGTDAGLISERARAAANAWARLDVPEGEILQITDSDLDDDRDRLAVELRMIPMFGGKKVVRTSVSQRINANLLKPLVEDTTLAATLVIEAGALKPTDTLRKLCEKLPYAAAVACFPDEERDISSVIREELTKAKLRIAPDAEDLLVARLGADRALTRGEIEKLALYCMGRTEVTAEDVDAIVGDASELAVDRIVMAAASGDAASAVRELARTTSAGQSPQMLILALQRHLLRLHQVRQKTDNGLGITEAVKGLRPPLHFKQRDAFSAQLRSWSNAQLAKALSATSEAALRARRQSSLEDVHAERLLLFVASLVRGPAQARRER